MTKLYTRTRWLLSLSLISIFPLSIWLLQSNDIQKVEKQILKMPLPKGPRPIVNLAQGKIFGIQSSINYPQPLELFLGIPYAQTTAGDNRFRKPVLLNLSTPAEDLDASQFGIRCPAGPQDAFPIGEDCLNLNIYRPLNHPPDTKLPVVVFIHGGSFNTGAGKNRDMGNMVAWAEDGIIGVSINYRIGALGFLASGVMGDEGVLNLGLWDQRMALEWVRDNIEEFGGDKDAVTLMGSSAGGHSVGHHLLSQSPNEPPLFHRAILESGAPTARAVYTPTNPLHEEQFKEFLALCSISSAFPSSEIITKLRALPLQKIKSASESIFSKYSSSIRWPFQPVIDNSGSSHGIITDPPISALKSGNYRKISILTGFNTDEGAMFVPTSTSNNEEFVKFFRALLPGLTEDDLKELDKVYEDPAKDHHSKYTETRNGVGKQFTRLEQAYGQFAYIAPVFQTAKYFSGVVSAGASDFRPTKAEDKQKELGAPVYLYHFMPQSNPHKAANHGDQSAFVTYNKELREKSKSLEAISGTMMAYWTSFILTGDPNAVRGKKWRDRPKWPKYKGEGRGENEGRMLVFGEGNDERAGGKKEGVVVQIKDDRWEMEGLAYWWSRTEKSEV